MSWPDVYGQLVLLADFINDNAGLWALVALPFAVVPAIEVLTRATARLRTAARDDERNLELLRKQLRRRRVEFDLAQGLVLDGLLEVRLRPARRGGATTVSGLYDAVEEGAQAFVVGGAGSGKSTLALTLVQHSLERSSADVSHPLMDVVSLRDWRGSSIGGSDWKGLISWIAGRLSRAHPAFGTTYFKRLLWDQRLIPCLDGLDEMGRDDRKVMVRILSSYAAAGFPLVVFSRDPAAVTTAAGEEPGGLSAGFDRFELLAPSDTALSGVSDWPVWERFIANARQPHRAAALLSNPLRLSIASLTWNRAERPTALAASEDPEAELWSSFFDRRLGSRANRRAAVSLRQAAGWVAIAATQRASGSFRPVDLYTSARADRLALAIAAVPIFAVAWRQNVLGLGVALAISIHLGLSSNPGWRLEAFVSRATAGRSKRWQTGLFLLLGSLFLVGLSVGGSLIESAFIAPLEIDAMADAALTAALLTVLSVALLFIAIASDLRDREGFAWLLSAAPSRALVPAVGALALGLGVAFGSPVFVGIGVAALICWLCAALGRVLLTASGYVPRKGLRRTCQDLTRVGILTDYQGVYRFRHDEISRQLGEETLAQLVEADDLAALPLPQAVSRFVDPRIQPIALERANGLTAAVVAQTGVSNQLAVTNRTLYLYFGALRPQDAMAVLSSFLRLNPASSARVHLAELLDAAGKREEAEAVWSEALAARPGENWIVNKWVRRQSLIGNRSAAFELLESRLRGHETARVPFLHLLLAELRGRFGDEREVGAAVDVLRQMRTESDRFLAHRATLERARLRAEVFDERDEAEALLRTILDEGPVDSLKYARLAQLRCAAGDLREAEQFGREAASLLCWNEDPTYQLEVLTTAARVCEGFVPQARRRAAALAGFGWSLPGRDARGLGPGTGLDGLLAAGLRPDSTAGPV